MFTSQRKWQQSVWLPGSHDTRTLVSVSNLLRYTGFFSWLGFHVHTSASNIVCLTLLFWLEWSECMLKGGAKGLLESREGVNVCKPSVWKHSCLLSQVLFSKQPNTCPRRHAQHYTFIYCASMPVEMWCSLFRTKHIPYSLCFKSLWYREDNSHLNERKQGACIGNWMINTRWIWKETSPVLTLHEQAQSNQKQEAPNTGLFSFPVPSIPPFPLRAKNREARTEARLNWLVKRDKTSVEKAVVGVSVLSAIPSKALSSKQYWSIK